jgi:thioredoxin 1
MARSSVVTVDIDQNNRTPFRFGVRRVPTVLLFIQGKVVAQKVGLPCKVDLVTLIDSKRS